MKQINIVLVVLIFGLVLLPFLLPNHIDEKFSYEIEAPIGLVYDEFSDLKEFGDWEMFTGNDTLAEKTFGGGEEEKEFVEWKSTISDVGNGKILIDKEEVNKTILYKLKFDNWEGEDNLLVDFEATTSGNTKVSVHYLSQEVPYFYRYFIYFNSPIKKLEASVERLNKLIKIRLEKDRKEGKLIFGEYKVVTLPKYTLMAMRKFTKIDNDAEVMEKSEEVFEMIYKYLKNDEDAYDFDLGFPKIYITDFDLEKDKQTIYAGINLIEDVPLKGGIVKVTIPEGEYLLTLHQGSREKRKNTIQSMRNYAKSKNIELGSRQLEVLLNDIKETDSLQLRSRIYLPIVKSK